MKLDSRQHDLVKAEVRVLATDARTLSTEKAAPRWELISIILQQAGLDEAAECARAAACRFSEGNSAARECEATLESLK